MVKQFLLYLLLDQGVALPLMIPLVIYGVIKGYKGEAMQELLTTSSGALCIMIICSIITIAVFLKKRYVKLRPGRIAQSNHSVLQRLAMTLMKNFPQSSACYSSLSSYLCWLLD